MPRLPVVLGSIVLVVVLCAAGLWYSIDGDRRFPSQQSDVVVLRGTTFNEIASQLADNRVIGNELIFRALAKLGHEDTAVRAGEYRFAAHQTQQEILNQLISGGAQVAMWVTIPEGYTAAQIAGRLQEQHLGSARAFDMWFRVHHLTIDGQPTKSLEGFLFPSTYLIPAQASPEQVSSILTTQFLSELPRDAAARAKALGFTIPQIVTIASLIEREAKADDERPVMASVYYNRLHAGMPLQVDATVEYALPVYKTELSYADLRIDSPYNSYTHTGLPPTPIANPGAPSIQAAFHPARTPYFYYVYKGNGHHAFAQTLEEHNANVARYLR